MLILLKCSLSTIHIARPASYNQEFPLCIFAILWHSICMSFYSMCLGLIIVPTGFWLLSRLHSFASYLEDWVSFLFNVIISVGGLPSILTGRAPIQLLAWLRQFVSALQQPSAFWTVRDLSAGWVPACKWLKTSPSSSDPPCVWHPFHEPVTTCCLVTHPPQVPSPFLHCMVP